VAGASIGMGRAVSVELASKGINLILLAREKEELESTAKDIEREYKVQTKHLVVDFVKQNEEMWRAISDLVQNVQVSILVNVVGGTTVPKLWLNSTLADDEYALNLTSTSAFRLTRIVLPKMVERNKGAIALIGSMSFRAGPFVAAYAGEKGKLVSFANSLNTELEQFSNVTVQCLTLAKVNSPGFNMYKDDKSPRKYFNRVTSTFFC
jgi:17beta-estradiol 17-dehydrogenase / very-long-chain 3-oxoacyl-CoA reductase